MKKFLLIALLAMFAGKLSFGQGVSPVVTHYYSSYESTGYISTGASYDSYIDDYILTTGRVGVLPSNKHITSIYVNYTLTGYNSNDDKYNVDGFEDPNGTGSLDYDYAPTLDLFSFDWSKYSHVEFEWSVYFNDGGYDDIIWDYYNP